MRKYIKINKLQFFSWIILVTVLINGLFLWDFNQLFFRTVISLVYLLIVPGWLVMLAMKVKFVSVWEKLVMVVGISVVFQFFLGLMLNQLLPLAGFSRPLQIQNLLLVTDGLLILVLFIIHLRCPNISWKLYFPNIGILDLIIYGIPVLFPLLAVFGARSLNNGGSNFLTMFMLGLIGVYATIILILHSKMPNNIFPWSLYFIGLGLLLMTSFRGWFTTGHDNQLEYYVFSLTEFKDYWNIEDYRDPYNASLSLTVFPTILDNWLDLNIHYVYKLVFQIIFAFSIPALYFFFRRFVSTPAAWLSAFMFMSFPTFINDITMLNRQEIGMMFFTLIFLVVFNKRISRWSRKILFFMFAFGMVWSHYSTTYVAIAVLLLTYLILGVIKKINFKVFRRLNLARLKNILTWEMVFGLLLITVGWNALLTGTTTGLNRLITKTYLNMNQALNQDLKSGGVLYSLFSWESLDTEQLFYKYVEDNIYEINNKSNPKDYYAEEIYQNYDLEVLNEEKMPLTKFGAYLQNSGLKVFEFNYLTRQGIAKLFQVFILVGVMILLYRWFRKSSGMDPEFLILCSVSIFMLGTFILLPFFSIEYGTLRFFQQVLVVLALPLVAAPWFALGNISKHLSLGLNTILFLFIYLSLSGFLPQLIGGYYPQLHLNNNGLYYGSYYAHESEISAIKWLASRLDNEYLIQSNFGAHSKIRSNAGLFTTKSLLPPTIHKDAYVFLDYENVHNKRDIVSINNDLVTYSLPIEFFNDNKDLIYNNRNSKIYK